MRMMRFSGFLVHSSRWASSRMSSSVGTSAKNGGPDIFLASWICNFKCRT